MKEADGADEGAGVGFGVGLGVRFGVGRGVGVAVGACVPQSFSYQPTNDPSAEFVMTRSEKDSEPSFSYHATVSSLEDADRTSTSPSPSTSIAKTELA